MLIVCRNGERPYYYGESCARPFARRRFRIRRPAFVAMRARNPCVRARLIRLGWNVRFICLKSWAIFEMATLEGFTIQRSRLKKEGRQGYAGEKFLSIE
jgi:hypothetical protein